MRRNPGTSRVDVQLAALQDIVWRRAMSAAFQPIVDLRTAELVGYEALLRLPNSAALPDPEKLFNAAEECNLLERVESLARETILRSVEDIGPSRLLFINCSPTVLSDPRLLGTLIDELQETSLTPHRVVLEVTERSTHQVVDVLSGHCLSLRERGFSIALDDVGSGVSGLNRLMSLRPNWIKLDSELVKDIDFDPLKQNLIRFFVCFAHLGNMNIVAEGIEREEELRTLVELGVTHGQGYYMGRPGSFVTSLKPEVGETILRHRAHLEAVRLQDPATVRIEPLVTDAIVMTSEETAERAQQTLCEQRHQDGVIIADPHRLIGWASSSRIESVCGSAPATPLADLASSDVPSIEVDATLAEAIERIAARSQHTLTTPLVVLRRGRVVGAIPVRQVLLAAADSNRRATSHISPLTGLPTRVQADRWFASRIQCGDPCDVVFIDLANFEAFNLAYGFDRGDVMLVRLSTLIRQQLTDRQPAATFAAHLGADHFVLTLPAGGMERMAKLIKEFEADHAQFFSAMDLAAQAFNAGPLRGSGGTCALTSPRVICLPGALRCVSTPRELHSIARRLHEKAGRGEGDGHSRLIIERLPAPVSQAREGLGSSVRTVA